MHRALSAIVLGALGCGSTVTPAGSLGDASPDGPVTVDTPVTAADQPVAVDIPEAVDVPEPPVDAGPATGPPPGSACSADAQCASRICVRSPGLSAGCAAACSTDAECEPFGGLFSCAVDRSPTGARTACVQVAGASTAGGLACNADSDCVSAACIDGLCRNACGADSDCTPGWRCGTVASLGGTARLCRAAPAAAVTNDDFLLFDGPMIPGRVTRELPVIVPADAVSVTWMTQDMDGANLFAVIGQLTSPSRRNLVDLRTWTALTDQPVRSIPSRFQVTASTVPSSDTLAVEPGVYRSVHGLLNVAGQPAVTMTRRMRAMVRIKRAPGGAFTSGVLRLQVIFVGTPGLAVANAQANARLQAAIAGMRAIYAPTGVAVTVVGYSDVTGATAQRLSIIDSRAELQELFTTSAPISGDVIPLFLVRGISMTAGLEGALGIAGGINGAPAVHGTVASGVAVGWETSVSGRRDILSQVMAHECGHFLGLWHARERQAACTTAGQMDCSPFGGVDPINDTPTADAMAARNLMYWTTDGTNTSLSVGQGRVMRAHGVVR